MTGVSKRRVMARAMVAAGMTAGLMAATPVSAAELKTDDQKVSYSFGVKVGEDLGRFFKELDVAAFSAGVADGKSGGKTQLDEQQMMEILQAFQTRKAAEQQQAAKQMSDENLSRGKDFMDKNAKKKGVTTLPDGLQYQVIASGKGESPDANDEVKVHYHGTLVDGTVFDSSVQRGEPVSFPVDGVIKGWTEVLQKMKVGDKWNVVIPPALAYGERAMGNTIGPNETLVFDIELLEVKKVP